MFTRKLMAKSVGVFILIAGLILQPGFGPPLARAEDVEVEYLADLLVRGNVVTPYGGLGKYENLLLQSEDLGTTWTATQLTVADGETAPDGTTDGDLLTNSAAASGYVQQAVTISAAAAADYTFSVWLKAGTSTSAQIDITFNGTSPTNGSSGALTLTSAWQRFSVKGTTATDTTTITAKITNGSTTSGQTIRAWGAQLEKASTPGVYAITTTTAVTASRGVISTGDILMPNLKLSGGTITDTSGAVTIGSDLRVTGDGPHYISSGNVGIGTASPGYTFDVLTPSNRATLAHLTRGGTGEPEIFIDSGGLSPDSIRISSSEALVLAADVGTDGFNAGEEDLMITAGNVGIGTTTPDTLLHVDGSIMTPYGGIGIYENLLKYSEALDDAIWTKSTNTSISATNISAPDGTTDGDAITFAAVAGTDTIKQVSATAAGTTQFTGSVWLKAAGAVTVRLGVIDEAVTPIGTYSNCSVTTSWQRFSASHNYGAGTAGTSNAVLIIDDNASASAITIHAWGAQLEKASSRGMYVATVAQAAAKSRGIISNEDLLMPNLKLSGGTITDTSGAVTIGSDLRVTGDGPHYISSGNLGIGTTNPDSPLHIVGSSRANRIVASTGTAGVWTQYDNTGGTLSVGRETSTASDFTGTIAYTGYLMDSTNNLQLGTNNTARISIVGANVGIGTTNPSTKLYVNSSLATTSISVDGGTSGQIDFLDSGSREWSIYNDDNLYFYEDLTGDVIRMTIESGGNVGIGTTGPSSLLHLLGSQPAAVGTTPGTAATDALTITGGTGGNTTIATTGVGGIGADLALTGGTGGIADSAATASTGGKGGGFVLTGGTGGAASVVGTGTNIGGAGADLEFIGGTGGAASGGASNTGGVGGDIYIVGGAAGSGGSPAVGDVLLGIMSGGTATGNVGIGTTSPGQKLQVAGTVESTSGGFKFPDGTTQTTAVSSGASRSLVIDHRVFGQQQYDLPDNDSPANFETRKQIVSDGYEDRQYIPLLPGYTITKIKIPFATNRTSFSFDWELRKHDNYATGTTIASGTATGSANEWQTMDFADYTIENAHRTFFLIKNFVATGGTYTWIYSWEVFYTEP